MRKILFLALLTNAQLASSQIFSQNFESSTLLTEYASSSPGSGQFNSISTTGAGTTVEISSGRLLFSRNASNTGSFSRTTDINGTNFIAMRFELSVSGNTAPTTTAAVFQFGTGFGTNNSPEANADLHSRFGINIGANAGEFSLRNISDNQSSPVFSGTQNVTWVINNTGSSQSYTSPAGNTENIANDKFDIWVGTTKAFDEASATTATQMLTDFKFVFNGGTAAVALDNIVISEYSTLPVSLTSFTGKSFKDKILLNWSTASEVDSKYFGVLKSNDGKEFKVIGKVDANGNSTTLKDYSFADYSISSGTQYYQLIQVDLDGKESRSEIIGVNKDVSSCLSVSSITNDKVVFAIDSKSASKGQLVLTDLSGKKIAEVNLSLQKGINTIALPVEVSGQILVATLRGHEENVSLKFYK